jgi:hypothetical protein
LVTLNDQFGDGWTNGDGATENAQFQYTAGYADNTFTSPPIRHKLNCSCDWVMGCIHPINANKNLIYTFDISSITDSVPEYHWEIMWKVQIVESGVFKGYFYGGYDTTLVINYNAQGGTYSYDGSSSDVWDLSACTTPSPVSLVSDLVVDGYSITDTEKKTLYSSENPFCSYTRAPTFSPSVSPTFRPSASPSVSPTFRPSVSPSFVPTFQPSAKPTLSPTRSPSVSPTRSPSVSPTSAPTARPTTLSTGRDPTPSPTIVSLVAQIDASTDLTGLSEAQVDAGVRTAFTKLTAETLSVTTGDISISSVTNVARRLSGSTAGLSGRSLATSKARISFTVSVSLTRAGFANGTAAVSTFGRLLTAKYTAASTSSELISLAVNSGSTTVTSATVITISSPTVDPDFTLIEVKTGTPTSAPHSQSADDDAETTNIIIGVVVGGTAFMAMVAAAAYYMCGASVGKISPGNLNRVAPN